MTQQAAAGISGRYVYLLLIADTRSEDGIFTFGEEEAAAPRNLIREEMPENENLRGVLFVRSAYNANL